MIVSIQAQERVIEKYNTKDVTTKQYIAFVEGMEAAFELIEKIRVDNLNR